MMMGVGNLTELTDADTAGINAILMGIISELRIAAILTTEVSPHARCAVREADAARRLMFAARDESTLPKGISDALTMLHEKKPFPDSPAEIAELAAAIKDPSFRIQVSEHGIHVYNRDGMHIANDPFELFPKLELENDVSHAFYLGVELARAQIAWQLGKRYSQDEELSWGAAVEKKREDSQDYKEAGTTLVQKLKP
jgi:dihydropteroate synthase